MLKTWPWPGPTVGLLLASFIALAPQPLSDLEAPTGAVPVRQGIVILRPELAPIAPPELGALLAGLSIEEMEPNSELTAGDQAAEELAWFEPFSYCVQPGDTVDDLAARFGVKPETVIAANRLADSDHIEVGWSLVFRPDTELTASGPADGSGGPQLVGARPGRAPRNGEEAFIFRLVEPAQESQRATGVPTSATIAQAILETDWGTSFLAREANNYFGIKAYARPGSAGIVWIDAWEVENGRNVTRVEPFRKYHHVVESLIDHGWFFHENPRYAHALQARHDPREFARRINAAGYATDPAYAAKLITYMDGYDLYHYDLVEAR